MLTTSEVDRKLCEALGWREECHPPVDGGGSYEIVAPECFPEELRGELGCGWYGNSNVAWRECAPAFTSDPAAALWLLEQVCEKLQCRFTIEFYLDYNYRVALKRSSQMLAINTRGSLPEAAARAALAAMEGAE